MSGSNAGLWALAMCGCVLVVCGVHVVCDWALGCFDLCYVVLRAQSAVLVAGVSCLVWFHVMIEGSWSGVLWNLWVMGVLFWLVDQ